MFTAILDEDFIDMEEKTTAKPKKETEVILNPEISDEKKQKQVSEKKKKKAKEGNDPGTGFWNDGRFSKVTGLLFILFSFVIAVAFTSYLFNIATDQSEVNGGISSLMSNGGAVKNSLGVLGAWLANFFINNLFIGNSS